jgi:hypothetical protein
MPSVQRQPGLHAMAHAPQLSESSCKLTHMPWHEVSSVPQLLLPPLLPEPPLSAPPTLEPACPLLAPASPTPAFPELPWFAPELPPLPPLVVAPALFVEAPAFPSAPALPSPVTVAPAEPPSDVVLLEQPRNERHAPQARHRNHVGQLAEVTVGSNVSRPAWTRLAHSAQNTAIFGKDYICAA